MPELSMIPEDKKALSQKQAEEMTAKYSHLAMISNDEEFNLANEGLIEATKFIKRWDSIFSELYGTVEDSIKSLKAALQEKKNAVAAYKEPYVQLEAMLRSSINNRNRALSLQKMEEEKARQAEARKLTEEARKGDQEAAKKLVEQPVVKEEVEKKRVVTEGGKTTSKKRLTYEVIDKSLMPMDLLVADAFKINALIRTGTREIPGIQIFETEDVTVRI